MDILNEALKIIKDSKYLVALTGAGASTESNIPDFRSAHGLYNKDSGNEIPPEQILSYSFFINNPDKFYEYYKENLIHKNAKPNNTHTGLAFLENINKLKAVITQNIDNLHQKAGCKNVFELHGSAYRNYCMDCGTRYDISCLDNSNIPICTECNGLIRPDVTLYGEMLNENVINTSINHIKKADVMLVLGSSLLVQPAAGLLDYFGKKPLIIVNLEPTPYDSYALYNIREKTGFFMEYIKDNI